MTSSNQTLAKEVETLLNTAEQALERQEWPLANVLLKRGLDTLGDRYTASNTIDDSGMKLVLADAEEKKGNLQTSAQIRQSVLASRLSLFVNKQHPDQSTRLLKAAPLERHSGDICPHGGAWITTAGLGTTRVFRQGEMLPDINGKGVTWIFWRDA